MAALLGAVILWGGSFACMRFVLQSINPWSTMWLRMAIALVLILPQAARLTPPLIHALIFLGAFVTLGAFCLYNWGMSQIPAGKAAVFINLVPVIAVLLGWLVMNEVLTTGQWLATLAVIGGVWVSHSAARSLSSGPSRFPSGTPSHNPARSVSRKDRD